MIKLFLFNLNPFFFSFHLLDEPFFETEIELFSTINSTYSCFIFLVFLNLNHYSQYLNSLYVELSYF